MSTTIFPEEKIKQAIKKTTENGKYMWDFIKKFPSPSVNSLNEETRKKLEDYSLTLSIAIEPLGSLYILQGDYDLAQQAFSSAVKFRKLHIELSSPSKYNWYADILFLFKNAILSLDPTELVNLANFPYWQNPLSEKRSQANLVAEALGHLALGNDLQVKELVELGGSHKSGWAGGGLKTIDAIINNNFETLKEGVNQLVHAHIGANSPYLSSLHTSIALFPTAYLILAVQRGIDLGEWDPKYIPMDYVRLAKRG